MQQTTLTSTQDTGFFGHPRGLSTLFFTEMWERFSYYGMRAFLILYMVAPVTAGGLGFSDADAASIYGTYTASAWGLAILGGIIADRWLGQYRSVLVGGMIIAAGHITLAFPPVPFFYAGLALVAAGTGLLKPNVSTLVGSLYDQADARRDAGFSLFYMGINIGAIAGPLIAGYLAQRVDWHIGFGCAAVGMILGLLQYVLGKTRLQPGLDRLAAQPPQSPAQSMSKPAASGLLGFSAAEWKGIGAIVIFFLAATLFWGAYEQQGSTLNLFADRYTRLEIFGFSFPSSWFQSVPPIFVVIFAPTFAWLWLRLGPREPSVPAKIALGLLFMGLSFLILVPAGAMAQADGGTRVSPWWLIAVYMGATFGEVCLYPVGLSAVTKVSPARIVGLMMGVWFLSNAFGSKLAGWSAGFFSSMPLETLFTIVTTVLLVTALVMFALVKPLRRLMGNTR
jgi:POT family proton-dependent oligopeptide transporter